MLLIVHNALISVQVVYKPILHAYHVKAQIEFPIIKTMIFHASILNKFKLI